MDIDEIDATQNASIASPPSKRFHPLPSPMRKQHHRVRNPFEAALADRLHLPLIASPSLFQRPATPQLSSTHFEWTIDEVSSIKPANVEPHETQFQDSPDPEYEAKAQMAISSYFKEHQIVPSPVNCSVRQQRIILAEINSNTPIGKPGRRIRDFGTQTALTLPVDLPPALEEALQPYFQPQLAGCYAEDGSRAVSIRHFDNGECSNNSSLQSSGAHNVSMRRKLFDIHNIMLWDENRKTTTPKTPANSYNAHQQSLGPVPSIAGKLSDSLDKSYCDLLSSPISVNDCLSGSPHSPICLPASKLKRHNLGSGKNEITKPRRRSFLFNPSDTEELSPIYPTKRNKLKQDSKIGDNTMPKEFVTPAKIRNSRLVASHCLSNANLRTVNDDDDEYDIEKNNSKFTPDRSSSPLHSLHSSASACDNNSDHATTIATESFHLRINRLAMNSAKSNYSKDGTRKLGTSPIYDIESVDIMDDDDAMQISQQSLQNSNLSNCSINSQCDTPTGKRRSASRKNLSQSFSATWQLEHEEDEINGDKGNDNSSIANNVELEPLIKACIQKADGEHIFPKASRTRLPETHYFISQKKIYCHTETNKPIIKQNQQSQGGNFYRADSGFNEMTCTSSTISNEHLPLSQQDELGRETFIFNTTELSGKGSGIVDIDTKQKKSPYCSTPSKSHIECSLPATDSNEF